MARSRKEDTKTKAERLQTILRLVQEHPISRQEVLLEHLRNEGFEVTQATVSRDIRELCLVKAATTEGYRYVSSRNESFNPKTQGRFETIFHESVLGVDYAGHVVLVKCYSGMANAACEVFDALQWKNVIGTLFNCCALGARCQDHLFGADPLCGAEMTVGERSHAEQPAN